MRMWMIYPLFMCMQHRVGEHGEMHKHIPSFHKMHNVHGRVYPKVLIQFNGFRKRHDTLAYYLNNHRSPLIDLPDFKSIYPEYYNIQVDLSVSIKDLIDRWPDCRDLIMKGGDTVLSMSHHFTLM